MVQLLTTPTASERLDSAIRRASLALHEAYNAAVLLGDLRVSAIRAAASALDETEDHQPLTASAHSAGSSERMDERRA